MPTVVIIGQKVRNLAKKIYEVALFAELKQLPKQF
jgi:hypothetical protein